MMLIIQDLDEERFYSDPIKIGDDFYILLYKGKQESRIPDLIEIKDQLEDDYKKTEKRNKFYEFCNTTRESLVSKINKGLILEDEANQMGLLVEVYPEFTWGNIPAEVNPYEFQNLSRTKEGEISNYLNSGTFAILTYLKSKKILSEKINSEDKNSTRDLLVQFNKSYSINSFYNELIGRELSLIEQK